MAAATNSGPGPAGDITSEILQALSKTDPILSNEAFPGTPRDEVKAAAYRLGSRSMITYEQIDQEEAVLEPEAEQIVAHGSHEVRVFEALRQAVAAMTVAELEKAIGDKAVTKVGQGKAFKEKWISKSKDGKLVASVSARAMFWGRTFARGSWLTASAAGRQGYRRHARAATADPEGPHT